MKGQWRLAQGTHRSRKEVFSPNHASHAVERVDDWCQEIEAEYLYLYLT